MEGDAWISPRRLRELELDARVSTFDKFVDLALDQVITMDEAIKGYREEWPDEEVANES